MPAPTIPCRGPCALLLLLHLAIAWLPALAPAQGRPGLVSFQRIAVPEDVPARLVTALLQDAQGFLWIGTQDGLLRWDGYRFDVHRPDPQDPHSLGGSYVRTLALTRAGQLLVGSFSSGLSILDPRSGRFRSFRHDAADPHSLAHDRVEAIVEAADGRLWLATDAGLDRLDPASGRAEHFRHDPADPASLGADQVRGLLLDRAGRLWVGSRAGLQVFDPASSRFERPPLAAADAAWLAGQYVTELYQDSRGRLWIGTTESGAALLAPGASALLRLPAAANQARGLSHYWIYGFAEVADGSELWIATFGGGIDVLDAASVQVIDRLRHDAALPGSIGADRIGALLVDHAGLAWVGSWGGGLARHDPSTRAFVKLRHSPADPASPSHPAIVRAIGRADGSLWLGTNGNGIDVLDGTGRRIDGFRADPGDPTALADGSVSCLAEAPDGALWVATLNGVLHRQASGQRGFRRFDAAAGLPRGPVRSIAFGPDGALWAGAAEGLARIDPRDDSIRRFEHRPDDPHSLSGRAVESLAFDAAGQLWAGTENGLNRIDPASGDALRIFHDPRRDSSLPHNWVPDLMVAQDGRLWVATQGGAAILRSVAADGTAQFERLAPRLGLPPRPVQSLLQDAQGQVWLGARWRVNPADWSVQSFGPAEGNEFPDLYIASRARTADGRLLFGAPEGLLLVDPTRLLPWRFQPPVAPTSLAIDGRSQPLPLPGVELQLRPPARDLRLEYAALDLSAPQRLRYRHRLEGYDAGWIEGDASQRAALYSNLPPGRYRLRLGGSNRSGAWSPHEWSTTVQVLPAWHQTWSFRLLLAAAASLLLHGAWRLRIRRLQARSRELERQVAERTAALQAAYQRIEDASLTDPLTSLRNRRYLEQAIPPDLELAQRRHGLAGTPDAGSADLIFLLIDLDHFKQVNDQHGHAAGDAVLVQTAAILKASLRASDHVVRWGGEEFLLVARFVARSEAPLLAEKVRAAIAAHRFELPDGGVLAKTTSIGYAPFPFVPACPAAVSLQDVVALADAALYAAKRSGRNGWVGIEPGHQLATASDAAIAEAVRRFKEAPATALADGLVQVRLAAARTAGELRWE